MKQSGTPPPRLVSYVKGTTRVQADQIAKVLKEKLKAAQERMKRQPDLHRTERSFEVGERVFLHLQPYRQHSVAMWNLKLSPRFYGPYKIL